MGLIMSNYKFSLLVFGKRISQLVYNKLKDMECILKQVKAKNNEILDISVTSNDQIDFTQEDQENTENDPATDLQLKHLKMELANLEKQTLQSKMELEQWRQEAKVLENMLRKPDANLELLSDIQSDVISRRDESVIIIILNFSSTV